MGFKQTDLVPFSLQSTTPSCKDVRVKVFQILRTDTVASVKMLLPADATVLDFVIVGTASDAGTTATVSIGSTSTSTEYVNGQDVKGAGTFIRPTTTVTGTNMVQIEGLPQGADRAIYAKYAETGGASTVGSWKVLVYFTR